MNFKNFLISVVLFILAILVVGRNLKKPFIGLHDWNGARYGNIARNYVRYGFFTTRFAQVENSGEVEPSDFRYYTHWQPLLPILISVSYRFFGINEWATRLIPLLATAGAIVTLYFIGRTMFDWRVGVGASILALATPIIRYFGKNPVHEPLALFFALLAFLGASLVIKKKKGGWFLIYLGTTLTFLTNWSGVFLVLALTVILFKEVKKIKLLNIWLLGISLVGLHFLHILVVTGSAFGGGFLEAALQRTSMGGTAALTPFGFFEFLDRLRLWSFSLFTVSLLLFSFLGSVLLFRKGRKDTKKVFLGLLIWGGLYPLSLPNAAFIHNYFIYGLIGLISLSASVAALSLFKNRFYTLALLILLTVAVWFERGAFLSALENGRVDSLAVEIGKEINNKVPFGESVLVKPYEFAASRLPHLSFYSDKKIVLTANSGYNWEVEVKNDGSYSLLPRER